MTADQRAQMVAQASMLGIRLDDEATARLECFFDLLFVWNQHIRLTGERRKEVLVSKHGSDCLAALRYMPESGLVIDIGSGGGFPGIILACARPDIEMVLVESHRKASSFLREVIRAVPLSRCRVENARAEQAGRSPELRGRARLVITRGLRAPLFWSLARPFLAHDGIAVVMQSPKGVRAVTQSAVRASMLLSDRVDYLLPGGEPRTLLAFLIRSVS